MTRENKSQESKEAAPEGPPHELVHERDQKPAEASKGNLIASHTAINNTEATADQDQTRTDRDVQALMATYLSDQRLCRYAPAAADDGVAREDIYIWNCDLSEAFHFALHIAEISCRNSIHSALLYKGDRWFENTTFLGLLNGERKQSLLGVINSEMRQHGDLMDAHHLTSSLPFGFWEHLTTKRFQRFLFPKGFQRNFQHAPANARLQDLQKLIESVRRWRNRIAHHNAIFDKKPSSKYQDILRLISWSSPELETWVAKRCKVNQTINARPKGTKHG